MPSASNCRVSGDEITKIKLTLAPHFGALQRRLRKNVKRSGAERFPQIQGNHRFFS
jgi:hypothetical protein